MSAVNNILHAEIYFKIVDYIQNFKGLAIDCELSLIKRFKSINKFTLTSILFTECNNKIKAGYHGYSQYAEKLLQSVLSDLSNTPDITKILREIEMAPTIISRILIFEKYKDFAKQKILDSLREPKLIPNRRLARIVILSIFMDKQEGPIVDVIRRSLGEEYEKRLKDMATRAGLIYYDECDLRRTGFDKTPDIKLILPCLYKGVIINWIESKALFGDIKTHKRYIRQQFTSYINRFGTGIVIYWFGFLQDILYLKENGNNLIITNDFPASRYLKFF